MISAGKLLDEGPARIRLSLPRCYQTIPNQADRSRMTSLPSVEIFELYIVVDLGWECSRIHS